MGLRTFIAIEVPEDIQASISEAVASLRTLLADSVKWVNPGNIHLTLKFLGDTPEDRIEEIKAAISRATKDTGTIHAEVKGTGAFPGHSRPSVLWVGLQCPPALSELKGRIERELSGLGFEADSRPFSPHLTIGRIRRGARIPKRRLSSEISDLEGIPLGSMDIREIILIKSDLKPGGPIYTKLYAAEL